MTGSKAGNASRELVRCDYDRHGRAILDILNEAIINSTALYDYEPRPPEAMIDWFREKERGDFPVVGIEERGALLGFASYGSFRNWPAYRYSVEHSVYVRPGCRGEGLGTWLLESLIECARQQDYHVMVGGIDVGNEPSIRLHERLGFVHAGTVRHAGFKFGRWLDLAFYQRILDTPGKPVER